MNAVCDERFCDAFENSWPTAEKAIRESRIAIKARSVFTARPDEGPPLHKHPYGGAWSVFFLCQTSYFSLCIRSLPTHSSLNTPPRSRSRPPAISLIAPRSIPLSIILSILPLGCRLRQAVVMKCFLFALLTLSISTVHSRMADYPINFTSMSREKQKSKNPPTW